MGEETAIPTLIRQGKPRFSYRNAFDREQLSELVHRLGHEIDNPLTAIISLTTVMSRFDLSPEELPTQQSKLRGYSSSLIAEAWRVSSLVNRMVHLLSSRSTFGASADFNRSLATTLSKIRDREEFENIDLHLSLPEGGTEVALDSVQLATLLNELILNAHEGVGVLAAREGTHRPAIAIVATRELDAVELAISSLNETQCPMDLSVLFDPFISNHSSHKKLGLGLTVVWAILERAGGSVQLEEWQDGKYFDLRAIVRIPLASEQPVQEKTAKAASLSQLSNPLRILIVEDEPMVSSAIKKILELTLKSETSVVCRLAVGEDALTILDNEPPFQVILCDLNLKDINGRLIFDHVSKNHPGSLYGFAFITGDLSRSEAVSYLDSVKRPCLKKPFEPLQLRELVLELALQRHPA